MTHIFISHSSDDNAITAEIADSLTAADLRVWVDFDGVTPGDSWYDQIETRIRDCDVFLLVWSHAARRSRWVRKEMLSAIEQNKPLRVVRVDDEPLGLAIVDVQHIDLTTDQDGGIRRLVANLRRTGERQSPPRPRTLPEVPDKRNFFKYMAQLPDGATAAMIARDLYDWGRRVAVVDFGGRLTPGFHVRAAVDAPDAETVTVLSVWAYRRRPSAQVYFNNLLPYPPYDSRAMRRSLLASLDALADDGLLPDQADRAPTIPLSALDSAARLETFKKIIEEIIDNLSL